MSEKFINELYSTAINEAQSDPSVLYEFMENDENAFVLKHNINALKALFRFFRSDDNIFLLNGQTGSGKSCVVDFVLNFINPNTLIFKNSYREAIHLDDVLLSLFKDFSVYGKERKIQLPRAETSVFSEKINAFVKGCDESMLFIFDSFEINKRSKDTQKDILDFINWLSKFSKIKIIICSKSFKEEELISSEVASSYMLSPLSKEEMYDYINKFSVKGNNYELEELYKISKGNYILLKYSVQIMKLSGISLGVFEAEYKKSAKNFLNFLVAQILSLSSERYVKPLLLLALLRHGISKKYLTEENFASVDEIVFLTENGIISERFDKYYMKDYIKEEFLKSISFATRIKVHQYLVGLYEAELPLKPFERKLFLSRLTMRKEIAYNNKRISALEEDLKQAGESREIRGLSYLTYTKASGYEEKTEKKAAPKKRYLDKLKGKKQNKYTYLSLDDNARLSAITVPDEVTKHFEDLSKVKTEEAAVINEEKEVKIPDSLGEFYDIAVQYENAYNFSGAVTYYEKALTYKDDAEYKEKEPLLYNGLAFCYKKIQTTDKAIGYFQRVYEIYYMKSPQAAFEALLNIADIYCEAYNFDKAKKIYNKIINSEKENTERAKIRAALNAAELEINDADMEKAVYYTQTALKFAEKLFDVKLLAECYFKYALLLDDINNTDLAVKYYLRCVQTSKEPAENAFLAQAYTNLAEISDENDDIENMREYYILASEADKYNENYDGLYYAYSKLASIYEEYDDIDKAQDYLNKALAAAKKLDDSSAEASVYIQSGELYIKQKSFKKALKAFVSAKNIIPENFDDETMKYVNSKIEETKKETGEVDYIRIVSEIKKKDNVRRT